MIGAFVIVHVAVEITAFVRFVLTLLPEADTDVAEKGRESVFD